MSVEIYDYLPDFPLPIVTNLTVGVTPTLVVPANPRRWLLLITNYTGLGLYLGIGGLSTTTGAQFILTQASTLEIFWKRHGLLTTMAWYGVTAGGSDTVTVTQVLWDPKE